MVSITVVALTITGVMTVHTNRAQITAVVMVIVITTPTVPFLNVSVMLIILEKIVQLLVPMSKRLLPVPTAVLVTVAALKANVHAYLAILVMIVRKLVPIFAMVTTVELVKLTVRAPVGAASKDPHASKLTVARQIIAQATVLVPTTSVSARLHGVADLVNMIPLALITESGTVSRRPAPVATDLVDLFAVFL